MINLILPVTQTTGDISGNTVTVTKVDWKASAAQCIYPIGITLLQFFCLPHVGKTKLANALTAGLKEV